MVSGLDYFTTTLDSLGINTTMSKIPSRQYIKTLRIGTMGEGMSPSLLAHMLLKVGNEVKKEGWEDLSVEIHSMKDHVSVKILGVKLNAK